MNLSLSRVSLGTVALQFIAMLLLFWLGNNGNVVSAIITTLTAGVLTHAVVKNIVLPKRCYLPALMYLIVGSTLFTPSTEASLASLCLSISIWNLCFSFQREISFNKTFYAGFFLAIGALFAFECVFFLPTFLFGMRIVRRTPREIIIGISGFVLPLLSMCYIQWGFLDYGFWDFFVSGFKSVNWGSCQCANLGRYGLTFLIIVALNFALSLLNAYLGRVEARRRSQRFTLYFTLQSLCAISILTFSSSKAIYPLMAVSIAVILPIFFMRARHIWAWLIYLLLIGSAIVINL